MVQVREGGRPDLVFLGLVGRGHVCQVLDDLLGVLSLPSTRLSSGEERRRGMRRRGGTEQSQMDADQFTELNCDISSSRCEEGHTPCSIVFGACDSRAKDGLVFTVCGRKKMRLKPSHRHASQNMNQV